MRLTVRLKDQILSGVIKDTFKKREENLKQEMRALGDVVLNKVVGKHEDAIKNAPDGFYPVAGHIRVRFGESRFTVGQIPLSTERRIPYSMLNLRTQVDDKGIIKRYETLQKKEARLKKDKDDLKRQVRAMLESCTTLKKLKDLWPEVESYLPAASQPTANLPAIVAEDLNKTIAALKAQAA